MGTQIELADGTVLDLAAYPLPEGVEDGVLNRAQVARAFNVSENTVGKWIGQGMPVEAQGQNGVGYELRLSHCYAWKMARDAARAEERARSDQIAAQAALAFLNLDAEEDERPSLTAKQMKELSEAEFRRNQLAEQKGELVRANRVREVFEHILGAVRANVTTVADYAEREFGLTPAQVEKLDARCADLLRSMRSEIEEVLAPRLIDLDAARARTRDEG
jgi:phage terminase Nu1 subunit (DNA packaging protein)